MIENQAIFGIDWGKPGGDKSILVIRSGKEIVLCGEVEEIEVLEKDIEAKVVKYAKDKGLLVYKFTSPARAAVPDRLLITPSGKCFFIEFKAEGKKPTEPQTREHERLKGHNVSVFVVDNIEQGKFIIDLNS